MALTARGVGSTFPAVAATRNAAGAGTPPMRRTRPVAGPPAADSDLPPWDPDHRWEAACRHVCWGGPRAEPVIAEVRAAARPAAEPPADLGWQWRPWSAVRWVYRRVWRRLPDSATARVAQVKQLVFYLAGRSPLTGERLDSGRPTPRIILKDLARAAYRRHLRRWINPEEVARHRRSREPVPVAPMALEGLVYASILDPLDPAANPRDLLTAFLLAFRRRPDATLVLVLEGRWRDALSAVREDYLRLKLDHECRVLVVAEALDDPRMAGLLRATTYYVNTSRDASTADPLRRALAAGRPVIATDHGALAGVVDDEVGFVLESHPEPAVRPEESLVIQHRLVWTSLRDAFLASAALVEVEPAAYRAMATAARRRGGDGTGSVASGRRARLARAS